MGHFNKAEKVLFVHISRAFRVLKGGVMQAITTLPQRAFKAFKKGRWWKVEEWRSVGDLPRYLVFLKRSGFYNFWTSSAWFRFLFLTLLLCRMDSWQLTEGSMAPFPAQKRSPVPVSPCRAERCSRRLGDWAFPFAFPRAHGLVTAHTWRTWAINKQLCLSS